MKKFDEVEFEKIVITKKNLGWLKFLAYLNFFLEIIYKCNFRSNEYDVIYVHYLNHSLLPFFFVRKERLPPFVLNAHGSDVFPESKVSEFLAFFSSKIIKYATKVVVPSEYFKKKVSDKFNIEESKFFVSPSGGVDTERFKPVLNNNSIITIGFLSRIDPGKRWDLVIKAANLIRKQGITFKILIGGGGAQEDAMKKMIKEYNLGDCIDPLGYIDRERVPEFFKKIDLFIFPSEREGESLGLVNLEALASGVPVIGYDNGAMNEFITDNYNGFIYQKNSPKTIANEIVDYLNLPYKKKKELCINARESIQGYRYEEISRKLYKMLQRII